MQEPSPPRADLASLLLGAVKSLALGWPPAAAGEEDATDDATTEPGSDTADLPGSAEPEVSRFRVGEIINGRYAVLRILSEGSMGVVYRVRDQLFPSRRVALKTMQRVADSDCQAGCLFTMEFVEGTGARRGDGRARRQERVACGDGDGRGPRLRPQPRTAAP